MKTAWFLVLILLGINIYLWVFHTPSGVSEYQRRYEADRDWCEENGGRWIETYRNTHCAFAPK